MGAVTGIRASAALASACLLGLAGCGGEPSATTTASTGAPGRSARESVEPTALDVSSPDRAPAGSLGWALLGSDVPEAVLEIDTAEGVSLGGRTVAALARGLREHGSKAVEVVAGSGLPVQREYGSADLARIAEEHRSRSTDEDTVAVHVLVLPGSYDRLPVLGIAFRATTFVLFADELADRTPAGVSPAAFEAAVATHELGHLFGLVDVTGVGAFHEDENHPRHSANRGSVMNVGVEIAAVEAGELPAGFDRDDLREMELIREGRPEG